MEDPRSLGKTKSSVQLLLKSTLIKKGKKAERKSILTFEKPESESPSNTPPSMWIRFLVTVSSWLLQFYAKIIIIIIYLFIQRSQFLRMRRKRNYLRTISGERFVVGMPNQIVIHLLNLRSSNFLINFTSKRPEATGDLEFVGITRRRTRSVVGPSPLLDNSSSGVNQMCYLASVCFCNRVTTFWCSLGQRLSERWRTRSLNSMNSWRYFWSVAQFFYL